MKTEFNSSPPLDTANYNAGQQNSGAVAVKENNAPPTNQNADANQLQAAVKNLTMQFGGASALQNIGAQPVSTTTTTNQVAAPPPPAANARKGFFGWLGRAAENVGNGLKNAAEAVGSIIVEGGKRIGDALHSVGSAVFNGLVGAVKNVAEGVGDVLGGALKILDVRPLAKIFQGDFVGAFEGYGKNILNGLKDIGTGVIKATVQTVADAAIIGVVSALSAVQVLVGAEPKGRELNAGEIAELKKVYGDSIDYSAVRLKEGKAGLLSAFSQGGDRPFTLGNTIYMKEDTSLSTLVHEMGHVWQHQNGGTDYLTEALGAQFFGDGYDYEKGLNEGKSFDQLNPEQQSEFIQKAYESGFFNDPNARFVGESGKDWTNELRAALVQIRGGQGAP